MKKNMCAIHLLILSFVLILTSCTETQKVDIESERAEIEKAIKDDIGWALTKDLDLLYSITQQDSTLLIINPDSSKIEGFEAFQEVARTFWMDPRFKATHFEVKDLRITISKSGTVAWFYCLLDDFGEWDGRVIGWENVRWSGVVEKINGKWIHRQMHFSFPKVRG